MSRRSLLLAVALAAAPAVSCGLISSDVTDFNLRLPEKEFNLDTQDWMLTVTGQMPTLDCPPVDCAVATTQICEQGACSADCDANAHCQAHVTVSVFQMFDLKNEAPELQTIDSEAVISVTVETIKFKVSTNTLNIDSPPLTVYLAPNGVSDPNDPMAEEIGTIASVAAGQTGEGEIMLSETGKASMEQFMSNWRVPFNVIVTGRVTIMAGQAVPEGKLTGAVTVTAHAGL